jgi:hypothetical protein
MENGTHRRGDILSPASREARHESSSPPLEGWLARSARRGGRDGNVQIEFMARCGRGFELCIEKKTQTKCLRFFYLAMSKQVELAVV